MIKNETLNGSNLNLNVPHEEFHGEAQRRLNAAETHTRTHSCK